MACANSGYVMASRIRPAAVEDVILIQSDDDDPDSDDVVFVSDTGSYSRSYKPNCSKKPVRKKSRHRRKGRPSLNGSSWSSKYDESFASSDLVFTSAFTGVHASLHCKPAAMKKASKDFSVCSSQPFVKHQARKDGFLQGVNKGKQIINTDPFASKHSEFDKTCPVPKPHSSECQEFVGNNICRNSIVGPELLQEPLDSVADVISVAINQEDLASRDELASLADADLSFLSNIFCSDLSNDIPSDLPAGFSNDLAIDIANEFTALESTASTELENSVNMICHMPNDLLDSCLNAELYPRRILGELNDPCKNLSAKCNKMKRSAMAKGSEEFTCGNLYKQISSSEEQLHNACLLSSTDVGHYVAENSAIKNSHPGTSLCNLENSLKTVGAFSQNGSSNICDTALGSDNSKTLFDIDNPESEGNLLEMELLNELDNPLEISSLCAIENIEELQGLSQVATELAEVRKTVCLEDKDLDIDLSSTFIKNVLNLNVGETMADTCRPLNFSSIISEFDSLITADSHLPASLSPSLSFSQHSDLASLSFIPADHHHLTLSLNSQRGFSSDACVSSSSVALATDDVLPSSAYSSAASEVGGTMTKNPELYQLPLEKVNAVPEYTAIPIGINMAYKPTGHLSDVYSDADTSGSATLNNSEGCCPPFSCNSMIIDSGKLDSLCEITPEIQCLMPDLDLSMQLSTSGTDQGIVYTSKFSDVSSSLPPAICSSDNLASAAATCSNIPLTACNMSNTPNTIIYNVHAVDKNSHIILRSLPILTSLPSLDGISFMSHNLPTLLDQTHVLNQGDNNLVMESSKNPCQRNSKLCFGIGTEFKNDDCVKISNGATETGFCMSYPEPVVINKTDLKEDPNENMTGSSSEKSTLAYRKQNNVAESLVSKELSDLKQNKQCGDEQSLSDSVGVVCSKRHRSRLSPVTERVAVACKKPRVDYKDRNEEEPLQSESEFTADELGMQNHKDQCQTATENSSDFRNKEIVSVDNYMINSAMEFQKLQTDSEKIDKFTGIAGKVEEYADTDDKTIDLNRLYAEQCRRNKPLSVFQRSNGLYVKVLANVDEGNVSDLNDENFDLDCKIISDAHDDRVLKTTGETLDSVDACKLKGNLGDTEDIDIGQESENSEQDDKKHGSGGTCSDSDAERSDAVNNLTTESDGTEKSTKRIAGHNESISVSEDDIDPVEKQDVLDLNCDMSLSFTPGKPSGFVVSNVPEVSVDVVKAKCFNCLKDIVKSILAYCTAGHGCCSSCLHGQVKAFLATSSKSPFGCQFQGCNSFYLISQLRSSLPKMIVDILEEKLEREYSASTAQLLMKMNGIQELSNDTDEEQDNDEPVCGLQNSLSDRMAERDDFELPSGWKEMNRNEEFKLIDVTTDSEDFLNVSDLFHKTMFNSRATILRLQRLQNPVLWEFYSVKKKQKEIEGMDKEFFEKLLFHGIRREFLDTICLNNFDWRTCGVSHGIMYGQGTYFARDASYAHKYTDRNSCCIKTSLVSRLPYTLDLGDLTLASESEMTVLSPKKCTALNDAVSDESQSAELKYSSKNATTANKDGASSGWDKHVHLMFLARVIVGRYTRGKRIYRKPPPIDISVPYGKCYDSCVNYMDDPSLFVVFDSSQYYPEYLIHYTNKPKQTHSD